MLFKILYLWIFSILFTLSSCSDNKKEREFDELDRMAQEITQPTQHQNIAEEDGMAETTADIR
ncbi:MAG: hypothetical protein V4494_07145 [Chlamydiota bacterium]